jgi:hypothetical protein
MPINDFSGQTFVAFVDISGFKELMKNGEEAIRALNRFYQIGYDVLRDERGIEGIFISDCGVLFANGMYPNNQQKLEHLLQILNDINRRMLNYDFMLTTSVSYGAFDYHGKLEFDGIEKNPVFGFAYLNAYLDNGNGTPKIQPGQCRVIKRNLPEGLNYQSAGLRNLVDSGRHYYYHWNLNSLADLDDFAKEYNDSYNLKYAGMLRAIKRTVNRN